MDLFPDGRFVRLRSREAGKYVHANKDGIYVSLRPLDASRFLNTVWKVSLCPVEGGDDRLLLQDAAYGRYLAVANEFEAAVSGYCGFRADRAVQRHCNLPHQDPTLMWAPVRLEAGQNYVRLHNTDELCLRAHGTHLVTADARDGDETMMMQWTVEATPWIPEPPLPLPSPPQGAADRRYLAVAHVDDVPPSGDRFVRANRRHRSWNNRVIFDEDDTTTMQWTVEATPSTSEPLPVPPPPTAGYNAREIPLVTNLHKNADPMQIDVYTTGSQEPSNGAGDGEDDKDNENETDDDEEGSDYVPDFDDDDDDDDDDDYLALIAQQPALPKGVFTEHGVTYVDDPLALPELNPEVHILGFGPKLSPASRRKLWRRGNRRGFDFEPTEMLRWVWRMDLLMEGRNPGSFEESPNEPPVPNPDDYVHNRNEWMTVEEIEPPLRGPTVFPNRWPTAIPNLWDLHDY